MAPRLRVVERPRRDGSLDGSFALRATVAVLLGSVAAGVNFWTVNGKLDGASDFPTFSVARPAQPAVESRRAAPTWRPTREPVGAIDEGPDAVDLIRYHLKPTPPTAAVAASLPPTGEASSKAFGVSRDAEAAQTKAERLRRYMEKKERRAQAKLAGWMRPPPLDEPAGGPRRKPRFAYGILTVAQNHDARLKVVMSTWGRHANVAVIASDQADEHFPAIEPMPQFKTKRTLGHKTLSLWHSLCKIPADFYIMADDDSFLVVPNVEAAIGALSPQADVYTGYVLDHIRGWPLIGGGGGIVLSNYTMRGLCSYAAATPDNPCLKSFWPAGDTATMQCLKRLAVVATHTKGFYPFPPEEMVDLAPNWCSSMWWINPRYIACPPADRLLGLHYFGKDRGREYYFWTHVDAPILHVPE